MTTEIPTGTDTVRIELDDDGVLVIRFNRPERANALHGDMYAPIVDTVRRMAASGEAGCVVVTGEGRAFCAGGDVRGAGGSGAGAGGAGAGGSGAGAGGSGAGAGGVARLTPEERAAKLTADAEVAVVLHEAPVVTIAAVNGAAVGAGLSIALACDLRIASDRASFIGGWARLGFSGDFGGAWLLTHRVGPSKALELLATNATVDAEEAVRVGLVDRVVAHEGFDDAWRTWARTFASGPRQAIASMKANVLDAHRMTLAEAIVLESQRMVATAQTDDHREAVRAWLDKREPRFGGRRP